MRKNEIILTTGMGLTLYALIKECNFVDGSYSML